jgi:putative heme transporter
MQAPDAQAARPSRTKRVLQALISLAIGWALLVGVLPRLADLGQVWGIVRSMTLPNTLFLVALAVWNLFGYAFVMMASLPGLQVHHAFLTGQIAAAVTNTVPAGSVVGIGVTYAVLSSYGHGAGQIAMAAVLSGWWNTLVVFGLPSIAALILALRGGTNSLLLTGAAIGLALLAAAIAVLVLASTSERFARAAGRVGGGVVSWLRRLVRKGPVTGWDEGFARFQRSSIVLIRKRWHLLTVATLVSHLSIFWVLLACLRDLGVGPEIISWPEALGAFALVRLATAVPITPGGLGLVEVGMTAALVLAAGDGERVEAAIMAAVLLFRALTYLFQVLLGVISYAIWQREARRQGRAAAEAAEAA